MANQVKSDDLQNFKLDSMTKRVRCVINLPLNDKGVIVPFKKSDYDIMDELNKDGYQYAMIYHDKDTDNNGCVKTKHLHLVCECPTRRRVSYYIKHFAILFDVDRNNVSVEPSNSYDWDIQYLLHRNNPDKYQYEITDIMTNIPYDELQNRLFTIVHKEITAKTIFNIVRSCRTKTSVVLQLGLGNANLYKAIVDMYCKDGWLGFDLKNQDEQLSICQTNGMKMEDIVAL